MVAWSRTDHSHSRFIRKSYGGGNTLLSSVVSTWNTFTVSLISRPIRHAEWWRWLRVWSMNECERTIVCGLWWWARVLYHANPMADDLVAAAKAARFTLT